MAADLSLALPNSRTDVESRSSVQRGRHKATEERKSIILYRRDGGKVKGVLVLCQGRMTGSQSLYKWVEAGRVAVAKERQFLHAIEKSSLLQKKKNVYTCIRISCEVEKL